MTYEQAVAELEKIVGKIESGQMDIDSLAGNLKTAKELVAFCEKKLTEVDSEVKKILGENE